jgi:hypothetical protein
VKHIAHFTHENQLDVALVRRYAESQGYSYQWKGLKTDLFEAGTAIKLSSMAVIWNGLQFGGPLASRICNRRDIPVCYIEWGLLPQSATFSVDPCGFCGDSILAKDVSWVTEADMDKLYEVRSNLQKRYPLRSEDHVLAALQIENDSQILYFSRYRSMEEFVADIEALYPDRKIVARPHPKSPTARTFARALVDDDGEFLEAASKAGTVVSITSTCLYEAAILGVPVVAFGEHPLSIQPKALHERVLAGALALCIDRATGDLGPVLDRFGIRPL